MASLTRGISFRRQGSSGYTWSYNEEGRLVRRSKDENPGAGSTARIHNYPDAVTASKPCAGPSVLSRSKSVGCAPTALPQQHQEDDQAPKHGNARSKLNFVRWLKKTFAKLKKPEKLQG